MPIPISNPFLQIFAFYCAQKLKHEGVVFSKKTVLLLSVMVRIFVAAL